jgi:hypothetical protein
MRPVLTVLLACSVLAGCGSEANPTSPTPTATPGVNASFVLAPGQSAVVGNGPLDVRFIGVVSDNRCPGDALCITQGVATLAFAVRHATTDRGAHQLKTWGATTAQIDGYVITLTDVTPYPFASLGPIAPSAYRATVKITS